MYAYTDLSPDTKKSIHFRLLLILLHCSNIAIWRTACGAMFMVDSDNCTLITTSFMIASLIGIPVMLNGLYEDIIRDKNESESWTIMNFVYGTMWISFGIGMLILNVDSSTETPMYAHCPTSCVLNNISYHVFGVISNCSDGFKRAGCPNYHEYIALNFGALIIVVILILCAFMFMFTSVKNLVKVVNYRNRMRRLEHEEQKTIDVTL